MINEETARKILKNCWPKYRLEALIGFGGFGVVYRVRSEELERAVKFVELSVKRDKRARDTSVGELMQREWNTLRERYNSLRGDELVVVHDFSTDQAQTTADGRMASGYGAILMDYWPTDLERYLEDHPRLPGERKRQIVLRLAELLDGLYSRRHSFYPDLKPTNILMREDGPTNAPSMVIGDIGGLKNIHSIDSSTFESTQEYRAPEVVPGKPFPGETAGLRATLWSFGMMAFLVLQGRLPHAGASDLPEAIRDHGLDWEREAIEGLGRVVEAVDRCLQYDPIQRPEDFAQLLQLLQGRPAVPTAMPLVAHRPTEHLPYPVFPLQLAPIPQSPRLGDAWRCPVTGMVFLWIPAGVFMMGGDKDENEKPQHEVELDGFWMGKYPVTQGEWMKVMLSNPSDEYKDNYPVTNVSWNDAQNYIQRLNHWVDGKYRLPTEAEWEYACRAGSDQDYCFGNDSIIFPKLRSYALYSSILLPVYNLAVGGKKSNSWGLHDMHGNVLEWCQDWYENNYYSCSPRKNPLGPKEGFFRVSRGGAFPHPPEWLRSAKRFEDAPGYYCSLLGFRLARTFP